MWFKVSNSLVDARLRQLSGSELKVAVALCRFSDKTGRCWPSITKLSQLTGCSRGTVSRAIRNLISAGDLCRDVPGTISQTTRYRLTDSLDTTSCAGAATLAAPEALDSCAGAAQPRPIHKPKTTESPKQADPKPDGGNGLSDAAAAAAAGKMGLTVKTLERYIQERGAEFVSQAILDVAGQKKIEHPAGLLISKLKDPNYIPPKMVQKQQEQKNAELAAARYQQQQAADAQRIQEERELDAKIDAALARYSSEEIIKTATPFMYPLHRNMIANRPNPINAAKTCSECEYLEQIARRAAYKSLIGEKPPYGCEIRSAA